MCKIGDLYTKLSRKINVKTINTNNNVNRISPVNLPFQMATYQIVFTKFINQENHNGTAIIRRTSSFHFYCYNKLHNKHAIQFNRMTRQKDKRIK